MKRLLIVGNADVARDQSALVDSFDLVVRINLRKLYNTIHSTTGTKTDLLCYTPRAVNLVMNSDEDLKLIEGYCRNVSGIWFLRPWKAYWVNRKFLAGFLLRKQRLFPDLSRAFTSRLGLQDRQMEFVDSAFLDATIDKLWELNRDGQRPSPSAGIVTIEKVLAEQRFALYEKYLLGFSFEGWAGHPWETEKKLVDGYRAEGLLRYVGDT